MRRAIAGIAFAALVTVAAGCQAPPPQAAAAAVPDLSGKYQQRFVRSLAENPPFLPETRTKYESMTGEMDPLNTGCTPPGLPRLMNLNFPFEIVQTKDVVYILFEYDHFIRRIFIDGKHPEKMEPAYHGHSIGHWEGKTLVVDTVGFTDETWLDMQGHLHSDALHLIERMTRSDDGKSLTYDVTIDDPKIYEKPWQATTKTHTLNNDLTIQEFVCQY